MGFYLFSVVIIGPYPIVWFEYGLYPISWFENGLEYGLYPISWFKYGFYPTVVWLKGFIPIRGLFEGIYPDSVLIHLQGCYPQ